MLRYINKKVQEEQAWLKKVVQFKGGGVVHGPKLDLIIKKFLQN